jgi:hypothetical protein
MSDERISLSPPRLLGLAVFGAVVLTVFDGFHTHSGTTRYPTPLALEAAWWAPLNFALATGLGGPLYVLGYRAVGGKRPPPSWPELALGLVIFGALYFFSGFGPVSNPVKLAVLGVAALGLFAWLDRTVAGAAMMLVTALVGPTVESILVHAGAFEHLKADVLHVPLWLPGLYACSGPVIGQGARRWLSVGGGG